MVVFAGSVGLAKMATSLYSSLKQIKEQLIQEGTVIVEGHKIRFFKNVILASPSAASAIITGGHKNGRLAWKNGEGSSLKELEEGVAGA